MKRMMNITTFPEDLDRYRDAQDLAAFCAGFGLDGLEVMPASDRETYPFCKDQVVGVHMRCDYDWLDFWRGDTAALDLEYGSRERWEMLYGSSPKEKLLAKAREDLAFAKKTGAKYVVFHVSNIRVSDVFTYRFSYSDQDVLRASAEFINELLENMEPSFYFLAENLWWPGLRLTDPLAALEFLDSIHYPKKGIMLDTGHFLHTNLQLQTQEEAVDYLLSMLTQNREILELIKGIHLNQSISSDYVKKMLGSEEEIPVDYLVRTARAMEHIFAIDRHEPFTHPRVREIVDLVQPEYVTLEFISGSREEHAGKLRAQAEALGWI